MVMDLVDLFEYINLITRAISTKHNCFIIIPISLSGVHLFKPTHLFRDCVEKRSKKVVYFTFY